MHSSSPSSSSKLLPWLIWGLGCVFYFYENLLQVSPSVIGSELMHDFNVTSQTLGLLAGVYFYSYAIMQLPGGLMMDYFGPQRLLSLASLICGISTMAFGMTSNFYAACLARLMIGFGSAFAAVGCMKIAASWFEARRFPVLTGLMVTLGMIGAIGGEAPLALMIDHMGWRHSMMIMGWVGILIAVLIYWFASDAPHSRIQHTSPSHEDSLFKSLIEIMKNRQLWLVALYGGLMYLSTPVFCGLWGVPFLMTKLHISKTMAANDVSLVFVGWAVAGPLWGMYSNRIGLRKPPMIMGSAATLVLSMLFIFAPIQSNLVMSLCLFLFGFFSAAFLPAFTIAVELCNRRYSATGLSFMNMMNMIGIAIIQPVIGYVLDKMWQGELINDVRHYPLEAYQTSLSILPLCILISLILLPLIKETHCQSIYRN